MFKVERIRLKRFTPMALNDIEEIDISFKNDLMIVLGGNGSGKSSLLRVIFPIAPNKTDFKEGGYYENTSVVDKTTYQFRVERTGSSLVCHIVNLDTGEYVLDGVNPKVYSAKVEELLGLTKDIKELINGEHGLCGAPTALRRQWFTKLSTTNLSKPLSIFNKLKTELREAKTEVSVLTTKISDIKTRVVDSTEERDKLVSRLKELEADIEIEKSVLRAMGGSNGKANVEECLSRIQHSTDIILGTMGTLPTPADVVDTENKLVEEQTKLAEYKTQQDMYLKQLNGFSDEKNRYAYLTENIGSSQAILNSVKTEHEKKAVLVNSILFSGLLTLDTTELRAAKQSVGDFESNISNNIHRCGKTYSVSAKTKAMEEKTREQALSVERISYLRGKTESLKHELEHLSRTEEVNCPKCHNVFKPGVERSEESIQKELALVEKDIETLKIASEQLAEEISALRSEYNATVIVRDTINQHKYNPAVQLLINYCLSENIFGDNVDRWGSAMKTFNEDLTIAIEYNELTIRLKEAEEVYKRSVMESGFDIESLEAKIREVTSEYELARENSDTQTVIVESITNRLTQQRLVLKAIDEFKRLWVELEQTIAQTETNIIVSEVNSRHEQTLDTYARARDRYRVMQNEIDNLMMWQKDLENAQTRYNNLKVMVEAWSPEKGVLKRYFYNSIARISDAMSNSISSIWNHPLKVFPCDLSNGNMDYQFPYQLREDGELIDDVSNGSTAQKHVFDLTFRLAAYAALGFNQFPLLLDEPGTGFDEDHRSRLVDHIKYLVSKGMFSQLIVVSHLSDVHSKLNGADYLVLSEEGVTLPTRYNEDVTIKYEK